MATTNRPKPAAVTFETFGSETYIDWGACEGALLVIRPTRIERGVRTANGTQDAVVADILVVDGDRNGDRYTDQFVFPKGLFGQLKDRLGRTMLGRLGKGNPVMDEYGDPIVDEETGEPKRPWKFVAASQDDIATATAFIASQRPKAV